VKKKNTKPCVKTSELYVKLSTVAFVRLYHDITLKKNKQKKYNQIYVYIYVIIQALFMKKKKKQKQKQFLHQSARNGIVS